MQVDLTGRVAVITGGGGTLCKFFALALAKAGAKVALCDLNKENAEAVAAQVREVGGEAIGVACDVCSTESVRKAEEIISREYGQYHILINGAGGAPASAATTEDQLDPAHWKQAAGSGQSFFELDPNIIRKVDDINFVGSFVVCQVFVPKMVSVQGACILNISSMSALSPLTRQVAYSASKAAVTNFTQWLAIYLAKTGIRVNAIAPGFFITDINRHLMTDEKGNYSERAHKIVNGTPMGKFGNPEDLIGALLFLCDETASGFITGTVLPVDGGYHAYSGV